MKYQNQKTGAENIKYLKLGTGHPLVFLHGLNHTPKNAGSLIKKLSQDYEVIAPRLVGNFFNNQPASYKEFSKIYSEFIDSMHIEKHYLIGHSLGGTVAYEYASGSDKTTMVGGLNPAKDIDFQNSLGYFLYSGITLGLKELFTPLGGIDATLSNIKHGIPYAFNTLRNPISSASIFADISTIDYSSFNISVPSLMVCSSHDEFFDYTRFAYEIVNDRKDTLGGFSLLEFRMLNEHKFNHNWPLFYPKIAKNFIDNFINDKK